MDDHRAFDGETERVLCRERERLAGVDHRGDGDATDGIGHGSGGLKASPDEQAASNSL